jgi:prepilin-type N-terminal cleavage/methylation domain-containing protein
MNTALIGNTGTAYNPEGCVMNCPANQKGFSLVEALVVLAITSITGFAVMQTMRDSTNTMALSEAKFDELELIRQIQSNLVFKPACEFNFKNQGIASLTTGNILKVLNANDKELFTVGQTVGNRSLKIAKFEFSIKPEVEAEYNAVKATWPAGATYYMLDVQFKVTTEKLKTSLGGKEMTRTIPIKVKIDPSHIISECFSTNDAENYTAVNAVCAQMGGVFNPTSEKCEFEQNCAAVTEAKLIPAKCVDEKIDVAIKKVMADLAATRVPAAEPAASPTPPAIDPFKLPFSYTNPGPGCTGSSCAASDFGPCNGTFCTTNGGSCVGIGCKTGVTTGTVAYDGTNMFTPATPGPGCSGSSCHANDYGPCKGTFCSTNGGSCDGIGCRTGVLN